MAHELQKNKQKNPACIMWIQQRLEEIKINKL